MINSTVLLLYLFFASGNAYGVSSTIVADTTLSFPTQPRCETKRYTNPTILRGDAAFIDEWRLPDGSLVHAEVVRNGVLEVERCPCGGAAGPASVRVRVLRAKVE